MTGIVTTAVRQVTACLHVTTQQLSPTPQCTSIPWGPGSSTTQTPALTQSTVLNWTTGSRGERGRQTMHIVTQLKCHLLSHSRGNSLFFIHSTQIWAGYYEIDHSVLCRYMHSSRICMFVCFAQPHLTCFSI